MHTEDEPALNLRTKSGQWLVGYARGVNAAIRWHKDQAAMHTHIAELHAANGDPLAKHSADLADEHERYADHLKRFSRAANAEIERRFDEEEAARARADAGQFGLGA